MVIFYSIHRPSPHQSHLNSNSLPVKIEVARARRSINKSLQIHPARTCSADSDTERGMLSVEEGRRAECRVANLVPVNYQNAPAVTADWIHCIVWMQW